MELAPGDCLLVYTDAMVEANDANGEPLDEAGLLRIVRLLGDLPAGELIGALRNEIAERYAGNLDTDDVTILLVQANGKPLQFSFRDKVRAAVRLAGSLVRALNPKAERPPLPDAVLANIGGALIPALERTWRAREH